MAKATHPVSLRGDEAYYLNVAQELAAGHGHVHPESNDMRAWHPPGQAFVLSLFIGEDLVAERLQPVSEHLLWLPCALGAVVVLITGLLGRNLFGPRVGIVAAALCGLDPTWVAFGHYYWAEPLFTALVLGGLLGTLHLARARSPGVAVVTGLVFGAATLTREVAVVAAAAALGWLVASARPDQRRAALRSSLVVVALAGVVVLPWTWRNLRVLGRFVPVSTIGWLAAAEGNTLDPDDWTGRWAPEQVEFRHEYNQVKDELGRADFARAFALRKIEAAQPLWIVHKLVRTPALLLTPDTPLLAKLREGRYGPVPLGLSRALLAVSVLLHVAVVVLAALGAGARPRALPLVVLAAVVGLHVLVNAHARFRLPWTPLAMVFAAAAAVDPRGCLRDMTRRGWILVGSFLLYFFCVCVPLDRGVLADMWGGVDVSQEDDAWEEGFAALQSFVDREGHARVPQPYYEGEFPLSRWMREQRQRGRKGLLDEERMRRLEALPGWTWQGRRQ